MNSPLGGTRNGTVRQASAYADAVSAQADTWPTATLRRIHSLGCGQQMKLSPPTSNPILHNSQY
jgi:hypothetical protein